MNGRTAGGAYDWSELNWRVWTVSNGGVRFTRNLTYEDGTVRKGSVQLSLDTE